MASELNALPPASPRLICPLIPMGGGRTVLYVFQYRDTGDAAVLFGGGCGKVTNGRTVRDGLVLGHYGDTGRAKV